jgi:glycosyltransferase involved in cell wall biosynthesis
MPDPLVSIVMPTYRRPHYLRQALASAVGQTYGNLQIIVRDNASNDETPAVVRSFEDPRIEFLQAPQTGTAWENGIECFKRVAGKYVIPLCDDDILGENYVETLVSHSESDAGIWAAYGATHLIDENGTVTGKRVPNGTYTAGASELIRAWCAASLPLASGINYLCRTSFITSLGDRHCFPDGHNSDNAIFMAAGIRGKVLFTDSCVFYYRIHGSNTARTHRSRLRAVGDEAFLKFLDDEVSSPSNVGLPRTDWPRLRGELQAKLCSWYFHHLTRVQASGHSAVELVLDATLYPGRAYGVRNTLKSLRKNRAASI